MFLEKGVLEICSKFTGEHPCRSVVSIVCSPVNLLCIFRTAFLKNTSGWLLLLVVKKLAAGKGRPPLVPPGFYDLDFKEKLEILILLCEPIFFKLER